MEETRLRAAPPALPAVTPATETPFATLSPERVLDSVEAAGFVTNGRLLALNSYENRVWRVGLEEGGHLIGKFYRSGRWTDAAILEEHAYAQELASAELPVVPPLAIAGQTLLKQDDLRYTLFPNRPGRAPSRAASSTARPAVRLTIVTSRAPASRR